jgi:aryl-phospho-beta-D-glucosidase BglC (GH1 family)
MLAAAALIATVASVASAQRLSTRGVDIVDSDGTAIKLNCANWYGLDQPGHVPGGLQVQTPQFIAGLIKQYGFNCVRVPVSAELVNNHTTTYPPAVAHYPPLQGATGMDALDVVVQTLSSTGLRMILDLHTLSAAWCCSGSDGQGLWYSANVSTAQWEQSLVTLATRYKSNPWVVGIDLKNELRDTVIDGKKLTVSWRSGDPATDWAPAAEAAAEKVLAANPDLLIVVEGINYAGSLEGVKTYPIKLSQPGKLVYEVHNYGYWFSRSSTPSYESFRDMLDTKWGFIVTEEIAPVWLGEFGVCNSPTDKCLTGVSTSWEAQWWLYIRQYIVERNLHWGIWSIDGTQSFAPPSRTFNKTEGYGVLNATWNGPSNPVFLQDLQDLMQNRTGAV